MRRAVASRCWVSFAVWFAISTSILTPCPLPSLSPPPPFFLPFKCFFFFFFFFSSSFLLSLSLETQMNLPLRNKTRPQRKVWMEGFRASAVQAMKAGKTCALDLGECDSGKLPLEKTLCKPDTVPRGIMVRRSEQRESDGREEWGGGARRGSARRKCLNWVRCGDAFKSTMFLYHVFPFFIQSVHALAHSLVQCRIAACRGSCQNCHQS